MFVKKNREFYRDQEDTDEKAQDKANTDFNKLNKQKEKIKTIKVIKTKLSYLNLQLVKDENELNAIINKYETQQKQLLLKFLKLQINGFKNCYDNLQISTTMSNKNNAHIGSYIVG